MRRDLKSPYLDQFFIDIAIVTYGQAHVVMIYND